jgi:hypothetical protein
MRSTRASRGRREALDATRRVVICEDLIFEFQTRLRKQNGRAQYRECITLMNGA